MSNASPGSPSTTSSSTKWLVITVCSVLGILLGSYYLSVDEAGQVNGQIAVLSTAIGLLAFLMFVGLWKHESHHDSISVTETLLGVGFILVGGLLFSSVLKGPMETFWEKINFGQALNAIQAPVPGEEFSYDEKSKTLTIEMAPEGVVWVARIPESKTTRGKKLPPRQFILERPADGKIKNFPAEGIVFFQSAAIGSRTTSSGVPVLYGEKEEEERADPQPAS